MFFNLLIPGNVHFFHHVYNCNLQSGYMTLLVNSIWVAKYLANTNALRQISIAEPVAYIVYNIIICCEAQIHCHQTEQMMLRMQ